MNHVKLLKFTDFTMSVYANMDQSQYGAIVQKFLTIFLCQLSLMEKSSVFMVGYHLLFKLWTKLG